MDIQSQELEIGKLQIQLQTITYYLNLTVLDLSKKESGQAAQSYMKFLEELKKFNHIVRDVNVQLNRLT